MKASTLSILALALIMGLGLVIAVKYSGVLNPPEKKVEFLNLFDSATASR